MSDTGDRIRGFITSEIMFEDSSATLTDDTPLLGSVMDSLGLMQLVAFLEERFGIAIADTEITPDNFATIARIEQLVVDRGR